MKFYAIALLTVVLALFSSCRTSDKVAYFQDLKEVHHMNLTNSEANYEAKICTDDQLAIFVSSIDPDAVAVFNLPLTTFMQPGQKSVSTTPVVQSYLVDNKGDIKFPVLGTVHVAGLTRREVADMLQEKISVYAKNPLVSIIIQNFKISVLGEVNRPGTISIANERLSVLDALGLAGDLTIYGDRTNVALIRDNNGKKEYITLDLTSSEIFKSPYFYLQQNDVLYVEPNRARKGNSKYNINSQYKLTLVSTLVSAFSVLASLGIALFINK